MSVILVQGVGWGGYSAELEDHWGLLSSQPLIFVHTHLCTHPYNMHTGKVVQVESETEIVDVMSGSLVMKVLERRKWFIGQRLEETYRELALILVS